MPWIWSSFLRVWPYSSHKDRHALRLFRAGISVFNSCIIYKLRNRDLALFVNSVSSQGDGPLDRYHSVDPLSYFSAQPLLHNWCNKEGRADFRYLDFVNLWVKPWMISTVHFICMVFNNLRLTLYSMPDAI